MARILTSFRLATHLFLFGCMTAGALGAGIVAPDRVAFNYPPPPVEGRQNYFTVAEDGQARACIVLPEKATPEESRAAHNLRFYIQKATGASLAFVQETADTSPDMARVHVGDTAVAKGVSLGLPPLRYGDAELPNINGYLVKTVDSRTLIIRGATPQATMLGAVGLLRRYLGVRRYWPGPPGGIGDVVPGQPTLKLPEIEWRDWPYFVSRIMSGLDSRGPTNEDCRFIKFADFWRMNYTIPSNESYFRLMKAKEHLEDEELFPLINGKRFIPSVNEKGHVAHGWQPCVANPRVAEIMTESVLETFRSDPGRIAESVSVNDGYGDCTCEACRAMDAPGADPLNRIGLCDRYVKLSNAIAEKVAEQFPSRLLGFIAYGSMREPPTTVQLHPMLLPVLCVGGNAFEMWDKWQATGAKHMGIYLYHDDMWFIIPKLDVHQSAKRIRYMVGTNLPRHFYQEFYGIYPLDGMAGYLEAELCWDPRLDPDAVLDAFYQSFFGPAGEQMKAFYGDIEAGYEEWVQKEGLPHPFGKDMGSLSNGKSIEQFSVLPVVRAEQASKHLEAALEAAAGDALAAERIKLVKMLYDFAVPGARMYWAMDRLRTGETESLQAAQQVVATAREAVDNNLTLADYKYAVMEGSPAKDYADHGDRDTFYDGLQQGVVDPLVLSTIGGSFRSVSSFLVASQGSAQAVTWWAQQGEEETRPILKELMDVARFHASGQELQNMIADPSFEERGAKQPAAAGGPLPPEHQVRDGVNIWCGAGSPMSCSLTDEDARSGKYCFAFWQTQHAGVSEGIAVKGGENLLMSVWVKHNDGDAVYKIDALPRGDAMLPRTSVSVPHKPGEWQKVEIEFAVPPGARTVRIYVFVDRQAPDARILIDDFFIGKYPD